MAQRLGAISLDAILDIRSGRASAWLSINERIGRSGLSITRSQQLPSKVSFARIKPLLSDFANILMLYQRNIALWRLSFSWITRITMLFMQVARK